MHQAVHACSTPRVASTSPPVAPNPTVLRRGVPVDNGGLLKAITSAKSNRSDQAVSRSFTNRDRSDDDDLLQVLPCSSTAVSVKHLYLLVQLGVHHDRCT